MTVQPISHSEREELEDVAISEIFHDYPAGFSYFVYAEDQVFDAEVTPAGETKARFTIRNSQRNEHGSIVTNSDDVLADLDETAEIFVNSWLNS